MANIQFLTAAVSVCYYHVCIGMFVQFITLTLFWGMDIVYAAPGYCLGMAAGGIMVDFALRRKETRSAPPVVFLFAPLVIAFVLGLGTFPRWFSEASIKGVTLFGFGLIICNSQDFI